MFPIYLLSTPHPEIFNRNRNIFVIFKKDLRVKPEDDICQTKITLVFRDVEVEGEVSGVGFALNGSNRADNFIITD